MRIGVLGPKTKEHYAGAATFEAEFFHGIVAGLAQQAHTLVVFSRYERPSDLPNADRIEWVQVRQVAIRTLVASLKRAPPGCCRRRGGA